MVCRVPLILYNDKSKIKERDRGVDNVSIRIKFSTPLKPSHRATSESWENFMFSGYNEGERVKVINITIIYFFSNNSLQKEGEIMREEELRNKLIELKSKGVSYAHLGRSINISRTTISLFVSYKRNLTKTVSDRLINYINENYL